MLGAQPAFAFQKDPDVTVGGVEATVTQLLAPAASTGDTDPTATGVGLDPVGIDDSLTNPPSDPADSSPGTTFFVDNTPADGDCPPTSYVTIQSAVDASGPGDTVKVCPGVYPEQVRISGHSHDGLKLESLTPLQAVIQWPTAESAPLALVDFNMADQVTLRGFTITGPFTFPGCSPDRHEGVLVENAINEHIHHNHVTKIQNSDPALYGCQEGDAIAIGRRTLGTAPGSAHVDHNQVDEYQKNGVQAVNSGTVLQADHNVITGSNNPTIRAIIASNGVVVFRQAAATIDHNVVSQNQFATGHFSTGIILDQAPSGTSSINHNRVTGNDYGIELDSESNVEVSHNDVAQNTNDGITLCGDSASGCGSATDIVVRANDVENNGGSGIFLLGADANLVKSNQVAGNGPATFGDMDGIHLDANSTNNQVVSNQASSNVTFDCHDQSVGTGTAGTANTWQNDHGQTSSPLGICQA
jgi:parallel beta-helix repeat protein